MVGTGRNADLHPADRAPVSGVSIWYNAGIHPNTRVKKWLPLGPGFGATDENFGLELSFGRALTDGRPGSKIAIIKVAEGGTGLHDRWKAGTGDLYLLLVSEVKARLAELAGENPRIDGFVWMQGENDASRADTAAAYRKNLEEFLLRLRTDLGAPDMQVVAGLISTDAGWPYAARVREATSQAASQLAGMKVVETDDLPVYPADPAHLTSSGDWQLGVRFAGAVPSGPQLPKR
jgi:hypothetical protein